MNLTKKEILDELSYTYSEIEVKEFATKSTSDLRRFFKEYIKDNSVEVSIEELFNNHNNKVIFIDTPDGFQQIGDLVLKRRDCIKIETENNSSIECSTDHLIETNNGWKYANNLSELDEIKTKKGFDSFKIKTDLDKDQKVYDMEILHPNHRYWSGGISNHNTSKTFSACYTLLKLLFEEKIERIIFTKPIKESGENLGFLPGSVEEKMAPYVESFLYTCKEMLGAETINFLIENGYIECRPLAYMRGISFKKCGMFLDEAQNVIYNQLMLYITRLGEGSKMIIAGDMTQRDIAKKDSCLYDFISMLKNIDGISTHEFRKEDIVRNKILIEITEVYEQWKEKNGK